MTTPDSATAPAAVAPDPVRPEPFEVRRQAFRVNVNNPGWGIIADLGIFDVDLSLADKDPATCPGFDPAIPMQVGCLDSFTWQIRLGPAAIATAPRCWDQPSPFLPTQRLNTAPSAFTSCAGRPGNRDHPDIVVPAAV